MAGGQLARRHVGLAQGHSRILARAMASVLRQPVLLGRLTPFTNLAPMVGT